jgi:hypothetical protein
MQVPWFTGAFDNQGIITWLPLKLADLASYPVIESPLGGQPIMYTVLGQPAPLFWIALAVLLGIVSYMARTGLFAMLGIGAVWMAKAAAFGAQAYALGLNGQGRFAVNEGGLYAFVDSCWFLIVMLVILGVQLTYASHVEKLRHVALGKDVEPGVLDGVNAIQTALIERISGNPVKNKSATVDTRKIKVTATTKSNK